MRPERVSGVCLARFWQAHLLGDVPRYGLHGGVAAGEKWAQRSEPPARLGAQAKGQTRAAALEHRGCHDSGCRTTYSCTHSKVSVAGSSMAKLRDRALRSSCSASAKAADSGGGKQTFSSRLVSIGQRITRLKRHCSAQRCPLGIAQHGRQPHPALTTEPRESSPDAMSEASGSRSAPITARTAAATEALTSSRAAEPLLDPFLAPAPAAADKADAAGATSSYMLVGGAFLSRRDHRMGVAATRLRPADAWTD